LAGVEVPPPFVSYRLGPPASAGGAHMGHTGPVWVSSRVMQEAGRNHFSGATDNPDTCIATFAWSPGNEEDR